MTLWFLTYAAVYVCTAALILFVQRRDKEKAEEVQKRLRERLGIARTP